MFCNSRSDVLGSYESDSSDDDQEEASSIKYIDEDIAAHLDPMKNSVDIVQTSAEVHPVPADVDPCSTPISRSSSLPKKARSPCLASNVNKQLSFKKDINTTSFFFKKSEIACCDFFFHKC